MLGTIYLEYIEEIGAVRGSDKMATDTTTLKGKYTESLTFSTPNCILYNFNQFIAHVTPWHAWRNFHFVTWLLGVWQGPDFVRCQTEAGYFSNFWLSLRWNIQWRAAAEAKFTCLWTKCPNLDQNCHNGVCPRGMHWGFRWNQPSHRVVWKWLCARAEFGATDWFKYTTYNEF